MRNVPKDGPPREGRIPARLRRMETVKGALRRLASQGHVEPADIRTLALDAASPFESRRDAITVVLATEDPTREILRDLLHTGDHFVTTETLKIIKYLGTEW